MAKILIVDDDPTVVNSTADMLKAISFEVISATDGRSGYRMAVKEKPDIIILDWMMPEYNGLQFITDYRKEGYQTPVFFLTGKGDLPLYQIEALSAGADSYLSKGSDPSSTKSPAILPTASSSSSSISKRTREEYARDQNS